MTRVAQVRGCSDALEHERDALTDTDTHRHHSIPAAGDMQAVCRGVRQPGTAAAERMAEGDGSAPCIDAFVVIAQAKLRNTAMPWAAKASLSSITSKSKAAQRDPRARDSHRGCGWMAGRPVVGRRATLSYVR